MNKASINISAPNLACICIDRIANGFYQGRFYHKYQIEPEVFHEVRELFGLMELLFERCGYPQSSTQRRLFQEIKNKNTVKEASQVADIDQVLNQNGDLATFVVHVKHRQHATWQGEVVWAEKQEKRKFRSALELLKLMDNALEEENEQEVQEEILRKGEEANVEK